MANEEGGIDTPLDLLANAVTGREGGLPGGNALGCGVMSGVSLTLTVTTTACWNSFLTVLRGAQCWLLIAVVSPFTKAKVVWMGIGGSICTFVSVSVLGTGDVAGLVEPNYPNLMGGRCAPAAEKWALGGLAVPLASTSTPAAVAGDGPAEEEQSVVAPKRE